MKKAVVWLILCVLLLTGCSAENEVKRTVSGNCREYCEMQDGTWECNGISYRYRLTCTGRLNGAEEDSSFVFLSNLPEISFDEAWKAGGLSSNTDDYFAAEDAVLVDVR